MPQANIIKVDSNTEIRKLVNPFSKGDVVKIPVSTPYKTTQPNHSGVKVFKRNQSVNVFFDNEGMVDVYFKIGKPCADSATIYSTEFQNILVGVPSITYAGTGGYWKDIELTEDILRFNGVEPEYKVVGQVKEGGYFRH